MSLIEQLYQQFKNSTGICTDTRKIKQGNIFFALKGPNFNGNLFAKQAIDQGCSMVVIDEPNDLLNKKDYFLVKNVLKALQLLANHHRKTLNIPIIGITGSNGKTTTKELAYEVLRQKYKTYATKGNLNNHIGVPLSLLELSTEEEVAVIEMGANKKGDIKELCEIAEPNFGLITNIGKAHLEGFGSVEGIKKTKGELYDFVATHGQKILVNKNEKALIEMSKDISDKSFYGDSFPLISLNPYIVFENKNGKKINTKLIGAYNHQNILSALAIADFMKVDNDKAIDAIANYSPKNNRSQIIQKQNTTIVLDAYNANPSSMVSAISSFEKLHAEKKALLLGEMLEIGNDSSQEHKNLLDTALSIEPASVIVFGKEFSPFKNEYPNVLFFEEKEALKDYINTKLIDIDAILIKGSRGNKLEEVVDCF